MKREKIKKLLSVKPLGTDVLVKGWVRTKRDNKNIIFIAVNDGSTINNIQIVVSPADFDDQMLRDITTGHVLQLKEGWLNRMAKDRRSKLMQLKLSFMANRMLKPTRFRKRTFNGISQGDCPSAFSYKYFRSCVQIRHAMAYAIHKYYNDRGFYYLHTPIITGSDCEGAGEMFHVTTMPLNKIPINQDGTINYTDDFFGKETNLTVSGQLEGELGALALGEIYTFGPTFRAENSNTPRHLAEFWMIEPEMAFYDLNDNMDLAEDFLKYLINYALENCREDLEFLNSIIDKGLLERLRFVLDNSFVRLTYTEAVNILTGSSKKWEFPVGWGRDLQAEHERYLVEEHFKRPVILTDYPKEIKAFYMKQNDDGKTVRAMDVLFPGIGEIIGGSQREEVYDKLLSRIRELKLNEKDFWWYLETRKFGTAPHSGFGLGFERLILFITGMLNIRDVIPFPRTQEMLSFRDPISKIPLTET